MARPTPNESSNIGQRKKNDCAVRAAGICVGVFPVLVKTATWNEQIQGYDDSVGIR